MKNKDSRGAMWPGRSQSCMPRQASKLPSALSLTNTLLQPAATQLSSNPGDPPPPSSPLHPLPPRHPRQPSSTPVSKQALRVQSCLWMSYFMRMHFLLHLMLHLLLDKEILSLSINLLFMVIWIKSCQLVKQFRKVMKADTG